MPEPTLAEKLRANLAALKQHGASPERIQNEVARWQEKVNAVNASDPERRRSLLDDIGATAQAFSDAATFGVSGLVDDALSPGKFSDNRRARAESKDALPTGVRIGAELAGSLAAPIPGGSIIKAAKGAGRMARLGASMGDAALQSGASAFTNNLNDASLKGVGDAASAAGNAAAVGAGAAGVIAPIVGGATRAFQRLRGIHQAQPLEDEIRLIDDRMKMHDKLNYAKAEKEGAGKSFQHADRALLSASDIAEPMDEVANSRAFRNADDATKLREAYKLKTEAERIAEHKLQVSPRYSAGTQFGRTEDMLAKQDMMKVASDMMPSFPHAVQSHAADMGEIERMYQGADLAKRLGGGAGLPAEKVLKVGPEAFIRDIPKMTTGEAQAALRGVLSRGREGVRMSSNPMAGLGAFSSAVRLPLEMVRTEPTVKALEEKLGQQSELPRFLQDLFRSGVSRIVGNETPTP